MPRATSLFNKGKKAIASATLRFRVSERGKIFSARRCRSRSGRMRTLWSWGSPNYLQKGKGARTCFAVTWGKIQALTGWRALREKLGLRLQQGPNHFDIMHFETVSDRVWFLFNCPWHTCGCRESVKCLCMCVCVGERQSKTCMIIFCSWSKVWGKGSDSAFGVRLSRERNNSRQKLENNTFAGNFNLSSTGAS